MHTHENALRMSRLSGQRKHRKENRDETILTHEKEVLSGLILRGRAHHPHTHTHLLPHELSVFGGLLHILWGETRW